MGAGRDDPPAEQPKPSKLISSISSDPLHISSRGIRLETLPNSRTLILCPHECPTVWLFLAGRHYYCVRGRSYLGYRIYSLGKEAFGLCGPSSRALHANLKREPCVRITRHLAGACEPTSRMLNARHSSTISSYTHSLSLFSFSLALPSRHRPSILRDHNAGSRPTAPTR